MMIDVLIYWTGLTVWMAISLCFLAFVVGLIAVAVKPSEQNEDSGWQ
jgi:hypothetical protein